MSSIVRATTPEVPEPQPGTWSNCLVAGGIAYVAGMTASGGDLTDEYTQAKGIFTGALTIAAAIPKCVGTRKTGSGAFFQEG